MVRNTLTLLCALAAATIPLTSCQHRDPTPLTFAPNDVARDFIPDYPLKAWLKRMVESTPQRPRSWAAAKNALKMIHAETHPRTLYCNCAFEGPNAQTARCSFMAKSEKVHWEHVAAISWFGKRLSAWVQGHPDCDSPKPLRQRRCAWKVSAKLREIGTDLHNVFPALQSVDLARGNRGFELVSESMTNSPLAACGISIKGNLLAIHRTTKGEIARALLYMNAQYPEFKLFTSQEQDALANWSRLDPAKYWECRRNEQISRLQGNKNRFITEQCLKLHS